jgi:hypothetical protein
VLAPAEVLQAARAAAPDGRVLNLSEQRTEPLPEQAGKGPRLATLDIAKVLVTFDGKPKVTITFHLDPLDHRRWLGETVLAGKRTRVAVIYGAGSVVEEISHARAAASLPEPARAPQPSGLRAFGGDRAQDTASEGGRR